MKKIFIPLWLISAAIGIALFACSNKKEGQIENSSPLPYYNSPDFTPEWIDKKDKAFESIHRIGSFSFTNQNGDTITNKDLQGKIYIADFFFTVCPSICPKMTSNLIKIQNEFRNNPTVRIVSHTVMPWVDSVSVLKQYAESYGIQSEKWHLLTGLKEEIYSLARDSYFAEKELGPDKDSYEFLHTENVLLIDESGRIRGVYNGTLPLEMTRLSMDIKTLITLH